MKSDYATEVTARIIADLETGTAPWEQSWTTRDTGVTGVTGVPMNAVTGRSYRGINTLLLWIAGLTMGTSDLRFLTFKQAKDSGGTVLSGSKGHKIYFYKPLTVVDRETGEDRDIPMLKEYTVFHVSQTENCKLKDATEIEIARLPEDAAELIDALGVNVNHGGNRTVCTYSETLGVDRIHLPLPQDFASPDDYRATLYHEIIHWTGHKPRLNRIARTFKGSPVYAFEELIAELGGAFLCAEFGLPYQSQHAAYLSHYLAILKEDKRAIFTAASKAQQAVDFIRERTLSSEALAVAA